MGASNNTSLSPKRAFLWCKLEFRISSGSGDIKFQVASNENLKMRQNRATLMPRKGASRRKTLKAYKYKNSRPGPTFESKGFLENEAHSHRLGKNFTPKLDNLPANSPRTFHGLLRKRMKAKTD